jgi:hypothetical protein
MAKVIKEFRDVNNFAKVYKVGDEVEFDEARLAKLVKLGLIEGERVEDENTLITDIDLTKMWMQVVSDVKSFTDVDKLKLALETESKADKPRNSVLDALQQRIEELSKQ